MGSGCWCVWVASAHDGPAYHLALHLLVTERRRHPSSARPSLALWQVDVSQVCWRGLSRPQMLLWRLPLGSTDGGRVPLSTSELECCREQSKLNVLLPGYHPISSDSIPLEEPKWRFFWRHKSEKIAKHDHKSLQCRLDGKTNLSHTAKAKFTEHSVVCYPVMNSYFLGGLLFDCKFPECMAGRERLASCRQWKGQIQSKPAQGQGRKKASFPYILRVGRMFPASVFVCVDTFLCVRAVMYGWYFKACTVLPQEFHSSVDRNALLQYYWKL